MRCSSRRNSVQRFILLRARQDSNLQPRFWSPPLATPALQRLLIFNDLALGQQRRRCWTTPALALFLSLTEARVHRERQSRSPERSLGLLPVGGR